MISEKRKHIRFLPKDDAYVALGTHFRKVGKLKDISIGGLAFSYIDNTEDCVQDSSIVAIFISAKGFYLPDLGCRLIYDSSANSNNDTQYFKTLFRINRCGLRFTALTEYQLDKLEFFMNHYT